MRDIRASVEARALIGADKPRKLHVDDLVLYECWQRMNPDMADAQAGSGR